MNLPKSGYSKEQPEINLDPCEANHKGNENSKAAHLSLVSKTGIDRRRIVEYLRKNLDGLTCEELETALGLKHQSCSARCAELKYTGVIKEDGGRATLSVRRAAILKVVK